MTIFVDETTKVVYQGLTGSQGRFYGLLNRDYGTQVVAGTSPKKAGTDVDGHPGVRQVADAIAETGATASCIFIPAPGVRGAVIEAAEAASSSSSCVTEACRARRGVVLQQAAARLPRHAAARPELPGIISPGKCEHRHHRRAHRQGRRPGRHREPIRAPSPTRRSTSCKQKDIGVTTCVGIGGDPVPGTSFIDCLRASRPTPRPRP